MEFHLELQYAANKLAGCSRSKLPSELRGAQLYVLIVAPPCP
jgi:hypothetical protein